MHHGIDVPYFLVGGIDHGAHVGITFLGISDEVNARTIGQVKVDDAEVDAGMGIENFHGLTHGVADPHFADARYALQANFQSFNQYGMVIAD